jgi:hypothetical protein
MHVMIAATALTLGVPLVTRNTDDVDQLGVDLLQRRAQRPALHRRRGGGGSIYHYVTVTQ